MKTFVMIADLEAHIDDAEPVMGQSFADADLHGFKLAGGVFQDVDFSGTNLARVDFRDAVFIKCNFKNAVMDEADCTDAVFHETRLEQDRKSVV